MELFLDSCGSNRFRPLSSFLAADRQITAATNTIALTTWATPPNHQLHQNIPPATIAAHSQAHITYTSKVIYPSITPMKNSTSTSTSQAITMADSYRACLKLIRHSLTLSLLRMAPHPATQSYWQICKCMSQQRESECQGWQRRSYRLNNQPGQYITNTINTRNFIESNDVMSQAGREYNICNKTLHCTISCRR